MRDLTKRCEGGKKASINEHISGQRNINHGFEFTYENKYLKFILPVLGENYERNNYCLSHYTK